MKRKLVETLGWKSTIPEMKNPPEGPKSRFEQVEERLRELQHRSIEIIQFEEQRVKRRKKSEWSLRELWDTTKCIIIWESQKERTEQRGRKTI